MKKLLGIDEAGVGPVMGPMIVAGVVVDEQHLPALAQIGVKDSKAFSASTVLKSQAKRTRVWQESQSLINAQYFEILSPEELDHNSLYDLEIRAFIKILKKLNWQDCSWLYLPQIGGLKFQGFLQRLISFDASFYCDAFLSKVSYDVDADVTHLPVSLASILAKTIRDQEMHALCTKIGASYISGYPNKATAKFLIEYVAKYRKLPLGIRRGRKWPPLQQLLNN